jgi:hypothetical protein
LTKAYILFTNNIVAKKYNKNHYPKLRWVLLLALAISIPVTIWTFNTAPTETRSNAATLACGTAGGACYKYSCPSGYFSISGTCGSMADSECCTNKLAKPKGLTTDELKCIVSGTEYDLFHFHWNKVPYATSYTVYYKIYGASSYNSKSTTNTDLAITSYKNLNGRNLQWKVKATRGSISSTSDVYYTDPPVKDCYWMTTP